MRVNLTLEFDDERRREIRAHYGMSGLATRAECREWVELVVSGAAEDLDPVPATPEDHDV